MANVKVAVRVRPPSQKEVRTAVPLILDVKEKSIAIRNLKQQRLKFAAPNSSVAEFAFDRCYSSIDPNAPDYASQETLFNELGNQVLDAAFIGFNASLLAYGQTGSGKTYTMVGTPGIFSRIKSECKSSTSYKVEISFLEIYNEQVRDLLAGRVQKRTSALRVREHPKKGPYVQGLSRHVVPTCSHIAELIEQGIANRTTAATYVHDASSRSHAIFTIHFTQANLQENLPCEVISKLNLVDLAGSERADPNFCRTRIMEGANINRSLVTLGNVISALAENSMLSTSCVGSQHVNLWRDNISDTISQAPPATSGYSLSSISGRRSSHPCYVPYRDSVLTRLLKDSLGGNAKTIVLATISPSSSSFSETMSTLRYAARAKSIVNRPRVNEDPNVRIIRELRQEVERLKDLLRNSGPKVLNPPPNNLIEMLHNSDTKDGKTTIGCSQGSVDLDIVLEPPSIEEFHCTVENQAGVVTLIPKPGSMCSINGRPILHPCQMNHGDILVLGENYTFHFNNPVEAKKSRNPPILLQHIQKNPPGFLELSEDSRVIDLSPNR
uniref:Kinesin-like protein n=1 Tax=Eptatretus burgeri TaxID=7764 RepID=A0A8C4QAF8_EPTBU